MYQGSNTAQNNMQADSGVFQARISKKKIVWKYLRFQALIVVLLLISR